MLRLCGDGATRINLRYDGDKIKSNKDLLLLMMGGYSEDNGNSEMIFTDSRKICENPKTLQLGWNTVVTVELTEGTFTLCGTAVLNEGAAFSVNTFDGYRQIVTRSVGSCTFVCVRQKDKFILAHLDLDYLFQALQIIAGKLDGTKGEVCFCSCVNGDIENRFKEELARHVSFMYHFSRMKAPACLNHMEIGICAEPDGSVKLFGDAFKLAGSAKEAPCRLIYEDFGKEFSLD